MSPVFFFGPMQWLEPLRAAKRNKQKDNKQASKHANQHWTLHVETKARRATNKQCRLFFFWSDAMVGAIACGQTKQINRQRERNTS